MIMKRNRRTFLLAVALLILFIIPCGIIYPRTEKERGFMIFRFEKWVKGLHDNKGSITPEEMRAARREISRINKAIWLKYPDLRVEGKDVDPAQNGYLALFDLAKDPRLGQLISLKILDQVNKGHIDPEKIRTELEAFQILGMEIERIAGLPERSSLRHGEIHTEFIPSTEVKAMGDYLLLLSRIAAAEGNEEESLRYFSLATNLTDHLTDIKSPTLLTGTISIILRMGMREVLFRQILPRLGESADLEKWNSAIRPRNDTPLHFAHLLVGEWRYFNENFMFLLFGEIPDPEQTALAYARWVEASSAKYGKMDLTQLGNSKEQPFEPFTKELSREGVAIFDVMSIGIENWQKGLIRSAVVEHYYAAAMDLLIREKKGDDLSRLTETFLPNPYTGKPFGYDPATRTLDAVPETDGGDIEALKLPW